MPAIELPVRRLLLGVFSMFVLLGACSGQQPCAAEVKLLLAPGGTELAVKALQAEKPASGRVLLYDTAALDLFSRGMILRIRQGATTDLTVKVRLPETKAIANASDNLGPFKCEVDQAGDTTAYSYSVQTKLAGPAPETGAEFLSLMSESQRQLLLQAGIAIKWSQVKRVADIRSTSWSVKKRTPFDKLDLELWEWAGGSVLELSTKADPVALRTRYDQLRSLAVSKGLTLDSSQQFKTTLVLKKPSQ
jgi:hypothetical protein